MRGKKQKRKQKQQKLSGMHVCNGPYEKYIKRPMDCIGASAVFCVLSPLLAVTALFVRINLGSPVLFRQERPGKDEKLFWMYKFRTMNERKDRNGNLLPDAQRLTPFGKLLRMSSFDELPELMNIIKGDMSFVGPRPLLACYLPYYTAEERQRHCVRPGLTGLAQIHGRNESAWDERFAYDVAYVNHITFWNDCKIMCATVWKIFRHSGIAGDGKYKMKNLDEERKQLYAG